MDANKERQKLAELAKSRVISDHYQRVMSMMVLIGQEMPPTPRLPSEKTRILRAKLALEEALEKINGLGVVVTFSNPAGASVMLNDPTAAKDAPERVAPHSFVVTAPGDLVEIVDGALDSRVIATGTLISCGVADMEPQRICDENNLNKFGPGHTIREDGKLVKSPDHRPPDLLAELIRQGYEYTGPG